MIRRLAVLACAVTCGGDTPEAEPPVSDARLPASPPSPESPIRMDPGTGAPGTEVTLQMEGLVMNAQLEIGFGDLTGHRIIDQADGGAQGRVSTTVTVPAATMPGTYYFFIAEENGSPLAVSDSFIVTPGP